MKSCIRGVRRLERFVGRVLLQFRSKVVILLYHRIFEAPSRPPFLCVTPDHFVEHLEYLRRHYQIMSLADLVRALRERWLPNRAVVITFDDGYADNLLNAKPLLERYEVPATVFATVGYIGQTREFWWDELERVLLEPEMLPPALNLSLDGKTLTWNLDNGVAYSETDYKHSWAWQVAEENCPRPRHQIYRALCKWLRPLPSAERSAALAKLAAWAGDKLTPRLDYRCVTPDELTQLAEGGLVEVGSHTMTHTILSSLPTTVQQDEIRTSKARLEDILGHPVTAFSYPYGGLDDIGQDTVTIVQEAGYEVACANFPWPVTCRSNPFLLPRYLVRDWNVEEFAGKLRGFFHGSP